MKTEEEILVQAAMQEILAGVVLRRKDWRRMSDKEKVAWLRAREILMTPKSPGRDPGGRRIVENNDDAQAFMNDLRKKE